MLVDDDDSPTRAELERIAFGRAETSTEIAAAQDALEELVARDAASAEAIHQAASPAPLAPTSSADTAASGTDAAGLETDPVEQSPRRRRTLVPLLVLVALFAGAVGGVLLAHAEEPSIDPSTADAAGATPTPGPTADAGAALKSLLVPQTRADKEFPLQSATTTLDIQPASIHRILTATDGATLWTGRTDTDICLMWSAPARSDGSDGGIGCATPTAFADGGLKLSEGLVTWTWDGTTFTTTVAN